MLKTASMLVYALLFSTILYSQSNANRTEILPAEEGTFQINLLMNQRKEKINLSLDEMITIANSRLEHETTFITIRNFKVEIMSWEQMESGLRWSRYKYITK